MVFYREIILCHAAEGFLVGQSWSVYQAAYKFKTHLVIQQSSTLTLTVTDDDGGDSLQVSVTVPTAVSLASLTTTAAQMPILWELFPLGLTALMLIWRRRR